MSRRSRVRSRRRSAARVLARLAAWTCVGLGVLGIVGWLIGVVVSDRELWSQYIAWISAWCFGVLVLGTAIAARVLGGRRSRRAGWLLCGAGVGVLAVVAVVDLRVLNVFVPARPAQGRAALDVMYWNPAKARMTGFERAAMETMGGDVVVIANPPGGSNVREVAAALGLEHVESRPPLHVLSRFEVTAWGMTRLGLNTRSRFRNPDGTWGAVVDHGRAMFVELDTESVHGGPTTLWILDLPSDPTRHRVEIVQGLLVATREWTPSPVPTRGKGPWGVAPAGWQEGTGFPQPDVIIGDLNIPRGSYSIGLMAPGFENAQRRARPGWHFSWPRTPTLLHIDQAFVAPGWSALGYRLVDPGIGFHEAQRMWILPPTR